MIGNNKTNVEEFPKWKCPYEDCGAENDITDSTRCWKCKKLKPTKSGYKRILTKIKNKKEKLNAAETNRKKQLMQIQDNSEEVFGTAEEKKNQDTNLEFDLDKLES